MSIKQYVKHSIPEEVQSPIRERFRLLRKVRKLPVDGTGVLHSSTIVGYEVRNISSLKFGDMFAFAEAYSMSIKDFINYLLGDDVPVRTPKSRQVEEVLLYMSGVDETTQRLICTMIKSIVLHQEGRETDRETQNTLARIRSHTPSTIPSPRKGVPVTE